MTRLYAFLIWLVPMTVFSQGVSFEELPPARVFELAKAQKKPVFYMFYATWCSHCNKMKNDVLPQADAGNFYNSRFICVWQDAEKADKTWLAKYGVKSYPTFAVIDPGGELLYSFAGEFDVAAFVNEGKSALTETNQLPYLRRQFENDLSNPDKCYAYVAALRKSNLETHAEALKYLSRIPEPQLVSEIHWRIIANGVRDIRSREFQYVLKNQEAFAKVSSAKRVERKILNMVTEELLPLVQLSDTLNYRKMRAASAAIGLPKTDSLVYRYDRTIFENVKDWQQFHQANLNAIRTLWRYPQEITSVMTVYEKHVEDPAMLRQAVDWQEHAASQKPSRDNYLLLSRIYVKLGQKNKAHAYAEVAREICVEYGWSTKDADELLQQIKLL